MASGARNSRSNLVENASFVSLVIFLGFDADDPLFTFVCLEHGRAPGSLPHDRRMALSDITNHACYTTKQVAVGVGCFKTSMTLENVSLSQWTTARERMFCEAVAACAGIVPTAVSVVSCHEKTGKRLLAIALQLTVEIQVLPRRTLPTLPCRIESLCGKSEEGQADDLAPPSPIFSTKLLRSRSGGILAVRG